MLLLPWFWKTFTRQCRGPMTARFLLNLEETGARLLGLRAIALALRGAPLQSQIQNPVLHTKLAASSVLPVPLYFATSGYWHSGRERVTVPVWSRRFAVSVAGALPSSTHARSASNCPVGAGPAPPPQCPTPGAKNSRINSAVFSGPPICCWTRL